MLVTSMSDYEKSSAVTYPFYFINRQSMHKTICMQRIKKILMREVFPAIALKFNTRQNEIKKEKGSVTVWALYAYFSDSQNAAFELLV